ncbi:hypothetical protein [Bdellovibrio sp. BCCA]|uniref:hypothetical protein n=1 Tax=Bdellovibrio sp. BCCA TaxID=3136281 RepID=UPI0030F31171
MTKFILTLVLSFSFTAWTQQASAAPIAAASQVLVTGIVEHVEAMENEAMVKIVGMQQLLIIKNLMSFPEAKIQALVDSQEHKTAVRIKVNEKNQIIDVIL